MRKLCDWMPDQVRHDGQRAFFSATLGVGETLRPLFASVMPNLIRHPEKYSGFYEVMMNPLTRQSELEKR